MRGSAWGRRSARGSLEPASLHVSSISVGSLLSQLPRLQTESRTRVELTVRKQGCHGRVSPASRGRCRPLLLYLICPPVERRKQRVRQSPGGLILKCTVPCLPPGPSVCSEMRRECVNQVCQGSLLFQGDDKSESTVLRGVLDLHLNLPLPPPREPGSRKVSS